MINITVAKLRGLNIILSNEHYDPELREIAHLVNEKAIGLNSDIENKISNNGTCTLQEDLDMFDKIANFMFQIIAEMADKEDVINFIKNRANRSSNY